MIGSPITTSHSLTMDQRPPVDNQPKCVGNLPLSWDNLLALGHADTGLIEARIP